MPEEALHRHARLPEVLLGTYLLALVAGTLYPWSGWRSLGLPGFGFMTDPWPRWWTWQDVIVNVAVYVPAGTLGVLALRRRLRPLAAVLLAVACASLLSMLLESLQSFLPGRVASRLDWLANSAGALLGAPAGAALARLRPWQRSDWLRPGLHGMAGATGVALLAGWLAIQMPPQRLPFGNGDIVEPLLKALAFVLEPLFDPGVTGTDAAAWLSRLAAGLRMDAGYIVLVEACGTAAAVVAIGLLVREIYPPGTPRGLITGFVLVCAAAVRSASAALLLGREQAFAWLSAGAQGGLVTGVVALAMLASGRRRARLWSAIAAIALTAVLTSIFPADPYHASMLQRWDRGAWRNFDGLLEGAALVWPFAAILWCATRLRALRRGGPPIIARQP